MFELRNIHAAYGETLVLRGVTVSVPRSSVVALLGPNGAGKTTLLKVASGLLRPRSGSLLLDAKDMTGKPPHGLAHAGVCHIPEGRAVFPALTVRDNLLLQNVGNQPGAIDRAIDAFPVLGRRLSQLAGTLSGGEQQMLALARAFIANPRVLLLDEVSMGLAPKIVDEIFLSLERVAGEGTSLLLVEQYVTRALELSDYVYMMNRGSLVFMGEPAELDEEDVFVHYLGTAVGTAH